ncbi:hypothetical protein GGD81_000345 [Rhodobium orientis]|uniref:PepSY domain-containing protein n=1 Tax=Rhodobium orientis TaxID=34017 RepID=A0A327JND6_9HYPH|nr:PepSY domain-containing protein [Rhodobium orientis]MBB4301330.1 hypothetical protein [Rhodobium orientis]MBK5951082.1 hypothetical protein [Rhodobium orientis]RAI26854.1 hypothetical protein CH339_12510 [Rhodobium orientis]
MIRKMLLPVALAAATGLAAASAQASDDGDEMAASAPRAEWMSVDAIAAKLKDKGYTVREIEAERNGYEVEMTSADGMRVKAYLDPMTGEPMERRGDLD